MYRFIVIFFFLKIFAAAAATTAQEIPEKLYSYTCSAAKRDLCIGTSPGKQQVGENLPLQLKNKTNNELQGLDDEKLRSDFVYGSINGTIRYSRNPNFCYQRRGRTSDLFLTEGGCNTTRAFFNTTRFLDNALQVATLQHVPTGLCATVMRCDLIKNVKLGIEFCDKTVNFPETSLKNLQKSAMIRLWPCSPKFQLAQIWRQREDCVPGCDANLQDNNKCDPVCNTELCNMDNGYCNTKSPTPPTRSPTFSPSINPTNIPTNNPTFNPSANPSKQPSINPSNNPSHSPTTNPSKNPSRTPSNNPSHNPSLRPTKSPSSRRPSKNPTKNPSASPTKSPTSQVVSAAFPWWWILLALLLLLCCCFGGGFFIYRRKKEELPPPPKDEEEVVEVIKPPPRPPTPPIKEDEFITEVDVFQLPPSASASIRTIRKEIDPNNNNYTKEQIGRRISFRKNNSEYKEAEIPAENLDKVVNELKNTIKKT